MSAADLGGPRGLGRGGVPIGANGGPVVNAIALRAAIARPIGGVIGIGFAVGVFPIRITWRGEHPTEVAGQAAPVPVHARPAGFGHQQNAKDKLDEQKEEQHHRLAAAPREAIPPQQPNGQGWAKVAGQTWGEGRLGVAHGRSVTVWPSGANVLAFAREMFTLRAWSVHFSPPHGAT